MPLVAKEHDPLNAGDPETQAQLETLARKTSNPDQEPEVLGLHLRLLRVSRGSGPACGGLSAKCGFP